MFKFESVLAVAALYKPWNKVIETYNIPVDANIQKEWGAFLRRNSGYSVGETRLGSSGRPTLFNSLAGMQTSRRIFYLLPGIW